MSGPNEESHQRGFLRNRNNDTNNNAEHDDRRPRRLLQRGGREHDDANPKAEQEGRRPGLLQRDGRLLEDIRQLIGGAELKPGDRLPVRPLAERQKMIREGLDVMNHFVKVAVSSDKDTVMALENIKKECAKPNPNPLVIDKQIANLELSQPGTLKVVQRTGKFFGAVLETMKRQQRLGENPELAQLDTTVSAFNDFLAAYIKYREAPKLELLKPETLMANAAPVAPLLSSWNTFQTEREKLKSTPNFARLAGLWQSLSGKYVQAEPRSPQPSK